MTELLALDDISYRPEQSPFCQNIVSSRCCGDLCPALFAHASVRLKIF